MDDDLTSPLAQMPVQYNHAPEVVLVKVGGAPPVHRLSGKYENATEKFWAALDKAVCKDAAQKSRD